MTNRLVILFLALVVLVALPWPAAPSAARQEEAGAVPIAIRFPRALVDTRIEPLGIEGGVPEQPSGIWSVGWYEATGRLGVPGNAVVFGYRDWWTVGPTVFSFLDQVREGHSVDVAGDDGNRYRYRIDAVQTYDRASAPLQEIFGSTDEERLTLLSDAEPFDAAIGYQKILVVRGTRTPGPPATAPNVPAATVDQPEGCPAPPRELDVPLARTAFPAGGTPSLRGAKPADAETVAAIDAVLDGATACAVEAREALVLDDGSVLALVGPAGDISLSALKGVALYEERGVADEALATMCDFVLFVQEDGEWRVVAVPWWTPENATTGG